MAVDSAAVPSEFSFFSEYSEQSEFSGNSKNSECAGCSRLPGKHPSNVSDKEMIGASEFMISCVSTDRKSVV